MLMRSGEGYSQSRFSVSRSNNSTVVAVFFLFFHVHAVYTTACSEHVLYKVYFFQFLHRAQSQITCTWQNTEPDRLFRLTDSNFIVRILLYEAYWQHSVYLCIICPTFITILLLQLRFMLCYVMLQHDEWMNEWIMTSLHVK